MRFECYTTSLVLNLSLVRIEKEKGLEYSELCCHVLQAAQLHLEHTRSKKTVYNCDLAAFDKLFKRTAGILPSLRLKRDYLYPIFDLPDSNLLPYADTIVDHAGSVSEEKWVEEWKRRAIRYLTSFRHVAKDAHEKISEELGNKAINEPKLVGSAPMPFGAQGAYYHENSDTVVFLTTGLNGNFRLYVPKRYRKKNDDHYDGYEWPASYAKMTYLIAHEIAHRCLHLSLPRHVDSFLHRTGSFPKLEEKICEALGLEVLLSRTDSDRKLRKTQVYRVIARDLFL